MKVPPLTQYVNDREDWSDRQIELTKVYYLSTIADRIERTRSNTSIMVWFLIVIPILLGILFFVMGIGALARF